MNPTFTNIVSQEFKKIDERKEAYGSKFGLIQISI